MANTIEDFKKLAAEMKELKKREKEIKKVAEKEGIKLVTARGKKERSDNEQELCRAATTFITEIVFLLATCFDATISVDKPDGQKWLTFREGNNVFGVGFQDYRAKEKKIVPVPIIETEETE